MNQSQKVNAAVITRNAVTIALVCILTMFPQIPIPLGYMHLGNCCILFAGIFFGPTTGFLAGGIGSAMADLLSGYPQWILPTLIIKSIMGFAAGKISYQNGHRSPMLSLKTLIASIVAIFIMVMGYFLAGSILYGSFITGAAQIPGLTFEGIIGIILFYILGFALEKANLLSRLGLSK